jgi:hypothetical protein
MRRSIAFPAEPIGPRLLPGRRPEPAPASGIAGGATAQKRRVVLL